VKKEIKRITCMCGLCGKTHDIPVLQYEDNMQIKDKEVWYLKTVYYCKNMDEEYCPEEIMDENLMSAREAYRREKGLLSAKSIQHIREKYGLSQEEYDKLVGNIPKMDIDAAKKFVADSFGFNPDMVLIMTEYPKQEINRHGKIRNAKGEFYAKKPLYESTDYNYILFSCAGIDYECVDGELYMVTD